MVISILSGKTHDSLFAPNSAALISVVDNTNADTTMNHSQNQR